jgi:hypothetical protein
MREGYEKHLDAPSAGKSAAAKDICNRTRDEIQIAHTKTQNQTEEQ